MKRRVWTLVFLAAITAACANGPAEITAPGSGASIEGVQIDGVWVFQHAPDVGMEALHSGTPETVNDCLVIGDTIVVWHVDRIEEAAEAVAAAKAGQSPQLLITGGGVSVEEGAEASEIPSVITDRCPTTAVWYGAP